MKNFAKLLTTALMIGCLAAGIAGCGGSEGSKDAAAVKQTVIYTNSDEEAQTAMKNALDKNGFEGKYIMQSFGTSELGGKLAAEGKNIEANVVTMTSYYLDSDQKQHPMFLEIKDAAKPLAEHPNFYVPVLGNCGALFVNTEELKKANLPMPKAIKDLADPMYKGHISVPDITGSSTAWLMTQAVLNEYGDEEGAKIMKQIEANAMPHLEKSGSGPLKKIRAGEVAVGFGLRHQAVADKAKGLPVDYVDPVEGNFMLTESIAVIDKNAAENEQAKKIAECILKNARPELLKIYPVALFEGEKVDDTNKPANPKVYKEPLTVELLQKHQDLIKK